MKGPNFYAAFVAVVWLGFLYLGIDGVRGIAAQNVPNYPNSGQITYCIGVPIAVLIGLFTVGVVTNWVWRLPILSGLASTGALFFLAPYLLGYGGGV